MIFEISAVVLFLGVGFSIYGFLDSSEDAMTIGAITCILSIFLGFIFAGLIIPDETKRTVYLPNQVCTSTTTLYVESNDIKVSTTEKFLFDNTNKLCIVELVNYNSYGGVIDRSYNVEINTNEIVLE